MRSATETLDQYFLEMRWRCLSLAADLDRIERAEGGKGLLESDARLQKLRDALRFLAERGISSERAAFVQMLFSDKTPPPPRSKH